MNVLITSAGSELTRRLATAASESYTIRLTELQPVETNFEFVQSVLGHDESTNELVKGMDTIGPYRRNAAPNSRQNLTNLITLRLIIRRVAPITC